MRNRSILVLVLAITALLCTSLAVAAAPLADYNTNKSAFIDKTTVYGEKVYDYVYFWTIASKIDKNTPAIVNEAKLYQNGCEVLYWFLDCTTFNPDFECT